MKVDKMVQDNRKGKERFQRNIYSDFSYLHPVQLLTFLVTLSCFLIKCCKAEQSTMTTVFTDLSTNNTSLNWIKYTPSPLDITLFMTEFLDNTDIQWTTPKSKTTTAHQKTDEEKYIEHITQVIFPRIYKCSFYMVMIFFFIGLIMNIVSVIVFASSKMASSPVGIYSICLSIADSLFLISEAFYWANDTINHAPLGKCAFLFEKYRKFCSWDTVWEKIPLWKSSKVSMVFLV